MPRALAAAGIETTVSGDPGRGRHRRGPWPGWCGEAATNVLRHSGRLDLPDRAGRAGRAGSPLAVTDDGVRCAEHPRRFGSAASTGCATG